MIICGHCTERHASVATVRACHEGRVFTCDWLVQYPIPLTEDGARYAERECGAAAISTERGWACEAGHEHVSAAVRATEGWDYAADDGEAALLLEHGWGAVLPDGKPYLPARR